MCGCLFLMIPLPPSTTLTDTLVPYTTLFRSEVRGETPVSSEPSQRSLDDPAPGPHDEAFCRIRSLDDLDGPFADAAQGIPELFARIATIGNDMAQPREAADDLGQHRSEEHTPELPSLMRISHAVFCSKKKKTKSDS